MANLSNTMFQLWVTWIKRQTIFPNKIQQLDQGTCSSSGRVQAKYGTSRKQLWKFFNSRFQLQDIYKYTT
jgi:hypothetical protein